MNKRPLILLMVALSACAPNLVPESTPGRRPPSSVPAPRPVPPPPEQVGGPKIMRMAGLESIIGRSAADITRQFGSPRLDVREGDARKLQFSGEACVLDIFFYPLAAGRAPSATWVEARRPSDGRDVDRASCVAALRR